MKSARRQHFNSARVPRSRTNLFAGCEPEQIQQRSPAMSQTVQLTVPMPANLARLRFPKALDDRLHFLLDEQGRKGRLTPAEKREAEGLVKMSTMLSLLKLGAQVNAHRA